MTTHLTLGEQAPKFDLPVIVPSEPDSEKRIKLDDFAGQYLVLYFYPRDNTSGCTTQATGFTQHLSSFKAKNTAILGVSADSLASHRKFMDKQDLQIPLGSDEDQVVCTAYGVWVEKKMYGRTFMGVQRSSFLISPDGKLLHVWSKVKVKEHIKDVLERLDKVQNSG